MLPFFVGTHYDCKLDSKGRLSIPARWRERLGTEFYMVAVTVRGCKCLTLYPPEVFIQLVDEMDKGTENQKYAVTKSVFSQAEEGFLDAQGRFTLNGRLKDKALLQNDTTVILQGQRSTIEIWSNDEFEKMQNSLNTDEGVFDLMDKVKADGE